MVWFQQPGKPCRNSCHVIKHGLLRIGGICPKLPGQRLSWRHCAMNNLPFGWTHVWDLLVSVTEYKYNFITFTYCVCMSNISKQCHEHSLLMYISQKHILVVPWHFCLLLLVKSTNYIIIKNRWHNSTIRPHYPQTYISKWRHPGKNFIKNDILSFKLYECFIKITFLYFLLIFK